MSPTSRRLLAATLVLCLPAAAGAAEIRIQSANFDATGRQIIVKGLLDALPRGTGVTLLQDSNDRVLATDVDGDKQFGFRVAIPAGQAVPCHVRIEAGDEQAFAQLRHSPTCGQQVLTLSGQVIDDPIPFATVTVTVGGVSYTTIADADGFYTLDIATATLAELVTIEAVGRKVTNGQEVDIAFTSLAGSFSKLLADAEGGVISSDKSQKVNVTNVSTAEYVLLVEANGGSAPTTVEELQQAESQVDATELLQLAAVIKLIVDGGEPLPAGYGTVLDLISDPAAVDAFVAEVEAETPGKLDAVVQDILESSGLVAGFLLADIPARYFVTASVEPGFIPRSGEVFEFADSRPNGCMVAADGCAGDYLYRDNSGRPYRDSYTWYLDDGVLAIRMTAPTATRVFSLLGNLARDYPDARMTDGTTLAACGNLEQQLNFTQAVVGFDYTRFADGAAVDGLFRRARVALTGFAPANCTDGVSRTPADILAEATGQVLARDSGAIAPRRFVAAAAATGAADEVVVEGQWALQVYATLKLSGFPVPPRSIFSDIVTLSAGGGVTALVASEVGSGPNGWSVDPATGDLLLAYPDGWTQRVIMTDSLDADGDGTVDEYGAFSLYSGPGGERYGSSDLTFKRDDGLAASASLIRNPFGSYWQTVVNSWPSAAWEDAPGGGRQIKLDQHFGWHAAPVGEGYNGSYFFPSDTCTNGTWFRRTLTGYEVEFPGSLNIVNMNYSAAGQARQRIWSVFSLRNIEGQRRLYVLELEKLPLVSGEPQRFPPRPNIYRELVEPTVTRGLCVTGFTPVPQP